MNRPPSNYEQDLKSRLRDPKFREAYESTRHAIRLAVQIRELRRAKGWTQAELARRMKTSQSAVARMESGNYEGYTVEILRRIAQVAGWKLEIRFEQKTVERASSRRTAG